MRRLFNIIFILVVYFAILHYMDLEDHKVKVSPVKTEMHQKQDDLF